MARHPLTGTRIRERRIDLGVRQADLAKAVGISPSYLNLIEHNRRRIAGKLLAELANALNVDAGLLTEGADAVLLNYMRAAAAGHETGCEVDRAEELAARYPGWAALIAVQARQIAALERQVTALNDRMTHDPQLASALHAVISGVTAIRSTASILVSDDGLDADWQRRFHQNIHADSVRLAAQSEALVGYFGTPAERAAPANPTEDVETFLMRTNFHFPELELAKGGATQIDRVISDSPELHRPAAADLARQILVRYAQDAAQMPADAFGKAAKTFENDPVALAAQFQTTLQSVLRRLATLQTADGHPPIGLVICDASGTITLQKTVPGFGLPRSGGACPLWPLFKAISQPGVPIRAQVVLSDSNATRFLCYAIAVPCDPPQFDTSPLVEATMLVLPDPPEVAAPPQPVGVTCRICPRTTCNARREPSILAQQPIIGD